jgi:mono/diheme cytochrome c family protein
MKYLLPLLLLGACAHSRAPVATEADATRAQARWPGVTVDELNHGRKLFVGHCGGCHLPPDPGDHSADAWPGHVSEMRERAGLSFEEQSLVVRYVTTMATR